MGPAARRRATLAIAASALAHVVVLAIAFVQRPTIPIPDLPEVPSPDTIAVQLVRLAPRPSNSRALAPLRLHRVAATAPAPPAEIAPLPAAPAPQPGPAAPAAAGPDLRLALRHGAAGCADAAAVGMTRAERELCNERLGRNMAREPFRPAAIEPRMRAYYDQVILAKAPDPQPVRLTAQGASGPGTAGMFSTDERITNGHGPSVGCKIHFGVGKPIRNAPVHSLHWGPCYIEPPKGSLTPEVDITPP